MLVKGEMTMTTKQNEVIENNAGLILEGLMVKVQEIDGEIGNLACLNNSLYGLQQLLSDINEDMQSSAFHQISPFQVRIQALVDLLRYSNTDLKNLYKNINNSHETLFKNVIELSNFESEKQK